MDEFTNEVNSLLRRRMFEVLADVAGQDVGIRRDIVNSAAAVVSKEIEGLRRARRTIKWDQHAIHEWQNATFGEPRSNLGIAVRANEEMAELLRCLARDDNDSAARAEVADVVIVLCRLAERLGGTIVRDVDDKMEVNVRRIWTRRGDGHGQHVRDKPDGIFDSKREPVPPCAKCGGKGYTSLPFEPTTIERCACRGG
jgi:NTP pyrophosphatase (non-canonical NTP hydrolase)